MGTCSSKDGIEKSVVSPPRSPHRPTSNNVNVPTSSSSTLSDARREYSTVADHPPTKPRDNKDNKDDEDDDDHPFFPHEAETPEVLSARTSTDDEKSNTDGKVLISAAFESSEEYATSKELQMSAHPESLPDDYHDALDKFGRSLTDSQILKSETNPLHESKSVKNDARPLTSRSFTERQPISEKSLEENKQEPLHSAAVPSKKAKELAKAFAAREESHRSTATFAGPEEVGNLSTRETAEAREAVASIQGQAKVSEIAPAIETATELAAMISSAVKDKETMEHESNNVKYAQKPKSTNADEQPSVSIPDLTEKPSETAPATSPATDIAANLPTTNSKDTTESNVETEKCDEESHTDQDTNATKEEDGANGTEVKGVSLPKHGCSDVENRDFHRKHNTDEQRNLSYIKVCGEPAMAQTPDAAVVQEVVEHFLAKDDAMLAEQTRPLEESQKKITTAPATDETMKPDVLNTYQVKQDAGTEEPESNHVEKFMTTKIINIDQQETIPSPAMDDQHRESHRNPATSTITKVVGILPTKENEQTAHLTVSINKQHEESDRTLASDVTTEGIFLQTGAATEDKGMGHESNNKGHVQKTESTVKDEKQLILSPALEEQHENLQAIPCINEVKYGDMLHTRNNAWEADPTITSEKLHKVLDPTAIDAIIEADATALNTAAQGKFIDIASIKVGKSEETASIYDEKKQDSPPTMEEKGEDPYPAPATNAVTEIAKALMMDRTNTTLQTGEHHKLSYTTMTHAIKEDILTDTVAAAAVLDVENVCKDIKNEQKNKIIDVDEQLNVSSPSLNEKYEESDTAQPTISALEVIKTSNAKDNTVESKQIILQEELNKELNTTSVIDATMEATNEESEDAKVEELESSGFQDLKEPESRSIDQQETVTYPVYQIEESQKSPVTVPVTIVNGMLPTNNSTQTTDLTIRTDEKHKESSRAPDANVKTEEDALLANVTREAKGSEHERNDGDNGERTQSTSAEKQSNLSPALVEQHEESQTCSDINTAKEVPETVHRKENAWEADLMIPSEELHDHSHMAATAIKIKADVIAINEAAKGEAMELESNDVENAQKPASLCVNKEPLHSPPTIEEQAQETDPALDTDGVSEIVESSAIITGTHISGIPDLKVQESRSIDKQETISYPSLVDQTEESHRSPVIVPVTKVERMFPTNNDVQKTDLTITTDENHKECRSAPDDNVRTEQDAVLVNAAREAQGLEHESNIDKNAERAERRNAEQQLTLSPAFEEEHEDQQTCSDINAPKEISETVQRKENAWEADPVIPLKELHDQSHTAATETKIEEDPIAINGVEMGEAMELESNKVENAQEPAGLCLNKEQSHSPPAIEEQGQETDPSLDTDGVTEVFESLAAINGTHIIGVQDLKEPESRSIDQQETNSYPSLVYQTEESQRIPLIVPVTEADGMFPTNNEARKTDLPITTDEKQKESSRAPDANVKTEEDALLINAAREPEGVEHARKYDENAERTETTNAAQQSTLLPSLEEHEDSQTCSEINAANETPETDHSKENAREADPVIHSEELHDQSHTAATETKLEDVIAINGVEKGEAKEHESNYVVNAQEPASLCVNKEQSHSPPAIEEQAQETDPSLDTDGVTEIVESLDTITGTHMSGIQDLKEPESRCIDQQETIICPSLVDQTEESRRSPVIIPVTKVDGMFPTNNEAHTKDLIITTDENHKESRRASDDNVRTEEDALHIDAAREAKHLEHERKIDKNAERAESTNAEQQSTLSPALEEEHEDPQTCSDINAEKEISETVHRKENAWEADLMMPSKELNDQSHIEATETKIEGAIAINRVEKGEATELESNKEENPQEPTSLCVNKEQSHSPPAIEEQGQETDPTLDTDRVTEVVESLATINGTHIIGVQDLKETESRSNDKQETISYPSLVYQTEGSQKSPANVPVTEVDGMFPTNNKARTTDLPITTDEKHKEYSTAPDANVRNEEDALLVNAARETEGLEHERKNDENAERTETKSAAEQSTLMPALEEQHEDSQICSEINAANEIPETVHRKENVWKADPVIPSEELPGQSHTAATETKVEEDAIAINGVENGEAMELESNNGPALPTDEVTEIAESLDTITGTHISCIQDLKEPESRSIEQNKTISCPSWVDQTEESHRSPVIIPVTKVDGMFPTNNEAQTKDLTITTEENHKESRKAPHDNVRTEEDALLVNVAREAKGLEHERNIDKIAERAESTNAEQQSTLSPTFKEEYQDPQTCSDINATNEISETVHRKENDWEADPMIPSKELHDQSHTAATETKMEEDAIAINGVEKCEATELESNKVKYAQEPASLSINNKQSHSPRAIEEQSQETNPTIDTDGVTEVVESLATISGTHIMGGQDLKEPESRSIDQQETILYPSLIYQTEESERSPVIVPVTDVEHMFPTDKEAQTTDLPMTIDENHNESSGAPDANVRTEEDSLLINAAREPEGLEHKRKNDENAERTETTSAAQQSTWLPALEEQHEYSQICSEINAENEIPEIVHRKENAWQADPVIPSEELPGQSHTTATETKLEDAIAINGVEKGETTELESNNDPALDTDGVTEIVESLDTVTGTHISGIQYLKETESRCTDQQETILCPSLVHQTEESHRSPVIIPVTEVDGMFPTNNEAQTKDLTITKEENYKEFRRAPHENVRTEEDALLVNAAREAKGLEHERNIDKNAERAESTNAEQQSTLSPAFKEEYEDPQTCSDINATTEISVTVHRKENDWEADLIIPSKELHDQSHTAATEAKIEEDAMAINGVEKCEATELESNKVEYAQEPASLCVNKEKLHFPQAIEKQSQETNSTIGSDVLTEVVDSLAPISGTHIMGVQDLKESESRSIDQEETTSHPSLIYQTKESQRSPVIVPVTEVEQMFPTDNEAQTTDLPITTEEKHNESSGAPDANVRTEEDALLINAAREPEGLEHKGKNVENAERTETTSAAQQSTLLPALEEHEDSQTCSENNAILETVHRKENAWEADPVIPSEELHDQSHTAATETKLEKDAIAINGVEKREAKELERYNVENAQEPTLEEKHEESKVSPYTNAATEIPKTIHALDNASASDLIAISEELHEHSDTTNSERKIEMDVESINGVAEQNVVEVKSNKVEKEEELASKYVDKHQSHSPAAMEEKVEDSDSPPPTRAVKEIVENLAVVDETTTAVQTEKYNEESSITTLTDLARYNAQTADLIAETVEQDKESSRAPATDAITEDRGVEHESDNEKNTEKNETTGADEKPSTLSPALEEQHEESQSSVEELHEHSDTTNSEGKIEKDVKSINGVAQGNVVKVKSNKVEKDEELASKYIDKQQSHSPEAMEEQVEDSDSPPPTRAVKEIAENLPVVDETTKEVQTEKHNEESNITTLTDLARDNAQTANLIVEMSEQDKESSRAPATDAITDDIGVEHESDNEKKAKKTDTTGADEQASTLFPALEEQHEESHSSLYINAATKVSKTLYTWDNASEADLIIATKELHKQSDTTSDRKIEADHRASDEVAERKVVEEESNEEEKAEESESKYVGKQQSHSLPAIEEQVEDSDLAPAINAVKENRKIEADHRASDEVAERKVVEEESKEEEKAEESESKYFGKQQSHSLPAIEEQVEDSDLAPAINAVKENAEIHNRMDKTKTAVQTGYHHKDSDITLLMYSTKDEDVLANNIAVKVVEFAKLEDKVVEKEKKHENADADEQKSVSSLVLKENCEETDPTQTTDTAPEAVETFADEQKKISCSVVKEHEETNTTEATSTAPEAVETFADEQQHISSSLLKENCEETDIAQATATAQEVIANCDTNNNEMVAKEMMEMEPHKEINMTLITNATTGAGIGNKRKHENVNADQQQSASSPVLDENSEETDTSQATDTAPEAVENFGDEQQNFSSFALKESEETDTTEATDTEPEAAETFNSEQQSVSSSVFKEKCEETDKAQAIETAPEAAENFDVNENAMVAKETIVVKEPYIEVNMTPITNATTEAGIENENTDADSRQSVSSPFLKEKCEETDTNLASNTAQEAVETFADEQQSFSSSVLKECEETNTSEATYTAPEAVEAFADEQQSTPSSVLKENCEETSIAQDTDTAPEAVENFYTNDNAMVAKETMTAKEPREEFNMTLITTATTDADVPTMDEIKENEKVQELEISSDEIIKEPESRWFDYQTSCLSSALEEGHEESHTSLVNSGSTEIVGILPTKNDAQTADPMVPTEEQHEQSNKAPATYVPIEADSLLINTMTEEGYVGHESSNVENEKEMITTGPHEQHSTLSPALEEQHAESEASPAIKEATEICETIDTWDIPQPHESMTHSEQHREESDTTSPHETTGIDIITIKAIADDEVVELESKKVKKADELENLYVEKQQEHSPTMREQDEESNPILATNTAIEILENQPTKDVAQTTDPAASSEKQFKVSDKTPVGDATRKYLEDVEHNKALSKGAQSMGCVTKNIGIAECPDTDASKQQTASFPTSKEECEESDIVQPSKATTQSVDTFDSRNNAERVVPTVPREGKAKEPNNTPTAEETRNNDIAMGTITEDIKVGGLESSNVENLEVINGTGAGQLHIVLSTYTFPARSAATEIFEALPTGENAKKEELIIQTKEWQKESESTLMTDAPRETGAFVAEAVDDKVVEQESNNIQNVEEGGSTNVYKEQPYLSPVMEECHEESQIISEADALTELAQIHYTRDKALITDPIAISEEVYEATHTTPATGPKSATDDIAINSITVGEAVQLKANNLENAEETENEMADEQQRLSSQALEEKFKHSNTARHTNAIMEIDETTGTRNNAQTEETRDPTEIFDISEKNTEAEILDMDKITEDVTAGITGSTTDETAEENSTDVKELNVLCQNLEEHHAVSAHSEIKEIADALLTRENTCTIYETLPIEEKHENTDTSPAINETREP